MNENEMNRALGHFCAHTGSTGPGEPPEDGEMSDIPFHIQAAVLATTQWPPPTTLIMLIYNTDLPGKITQIIQFCQMM